MTNDISLRYAEALFSLKQEENKLLETQEEAREIKKIISDNPDFVLLLDSSTIEKEEKFNMIDKTFLGVDEDIRNLLKVMVDNHRITLVEDVFSDFNSLVNREKGVKEGLVYTAFKLDEKTLNKLNKTISEVEGEPTELKMIVDPSIIGGIKVVVDDHIYDGSLKNKIDNMKQTLLKKEGEL